MRASLSDRVKSGGVTGAPRRTAGRPYGDTRAALLRDARSRRSRTGDPGGPGHGLPEPADGDLAVDLPPAGTTEPRHPEHRQPRRDDGWGEPPEDLHRASVGTRGADGGEARPTRARTAQGVPTHSSVPSVNRWCFQMGTSSLSVSISARDAANASPR